MLWAMKRSTPDCCAAATRFPDGPRQRRRIEHVDDDGIGSDRLQGGTLCGRASRARDPVASVHEQRQQATADRTTRASDTYVIWHRMQEPCTTRATSGRLISVSDSGERELQVGMNREDLQPVDGFGVVMRARLPESELSLRCKAARDLWLDRWARRWPAGRSACCWQLAWRCRPGDCRHVAATGPHQSPPEATKPLPSTTRRSLPNPRADGARCC